MFRKTHHQLLWLVVVVICTPFYAEAKQWYQPSKPTLAVNFNRGVVEQLDAYGRVINTAKVKRTAGGSLVANFPRKRSKVAHPSRLNRSKLGQGSFHPATARQKERILESARSPQERVEIQRVLTKYGATVDAGMLSRYSQESVRFLRDLNAGRIPMVDARVYSTKKGTPERANQLRAAHQLLHDKGPVKRRVSPAKVIYERHGTWLGQVPDGPKMPH